MSMALLNGGILPPFIIDNNLFIYLFYNLLLSLPLLCRKKKTLLPSYKCIEPTDKKP